MAKVTIINKNITAEQLGGFTSVQYTQVSKEGKSVRKLTATNDFISFDSGFVNDTGTWFAIPSHAVYEEDGITVKSRYENLTLDKNISAGLLKYEGEHTPLALRKPDLEKVEFLFEENTNENQLRYGNFFKLTIKGDGWCLPNVPLFKRLSGEVVIGAIGGVTLHPLLQEDILKSAYEIMKDKVVEAIAVETIKEEVSNILADTEEDEEVAI